MFLFTKDIDSIEFMKIKWMATKQRFEQSIANFFLNTGRVPHICAVIVLR